MNEQERVFQITLETPTGNRTISVNSRDHILEAAERSGITLPFICRQGRCLTCAGIVIGNGDFDSSDADMYFPEDRAAGFILLCTAKPRSDLVIRTHQQLEMRAHRRKLKLPAPYS
jgi:ferredoxin